LKTQTSISAQQEQLVDPLERSTPRGAISGFIRAIHRDDFATAASYMQATPKQQASTKVLARDLKELMDRYFNELIADISDSPTGALDDGLPPDRERVGLLQVGGKIANIILVRVRDPQYGSIWLISSETLAEVPALHAAIEKTWLERVMPKTLLKYHLFGFSAAQWLLWAASFAGPLLLLRLLSDRLTILFEKVIADALRHRWLESWKEGLRWPIIAVLTLIVHIASVFLLGLPLSYRMAYVHLLLILLVIAFAWLLRRIIQLSVEQARALVKGKGQSGTESLILLSQRVFNVLLVMVAVFTILTIVGVNTKTALAGVGIGGVAIAFGAQKSIENLLGGVFLLTDKALAIGDTCSISGRVGVVEDITLRSVRLRTPEQTLLSIPAGVLSQANIENFATRSKMLVHTNLQLGCETTVGDLRSVLREIQHLLEDNSDIERETAYVRLVNFGQRTIELELFVYILTSNAAKFLAVREALLLEIAEVVECAGRGLMQPTHRITEMQSREETEAAADTKTLARRAS